MTFLRLLNRPISYYLTGLTLLLILSSCDLLPTESNKVHVTPQTPTPSSTRESLIHFIDTWNNIHLFLNFDYNISNPAAIAKYYDFVSGADVDHVAALHSANA